VASLVLDSTGMDTFPPHSKREGPQHRVYVIEVEVVEESIPWNLYVGYTNLYLRERWERYEDLSDSVSKYFRKGHVVALKFRYDLMKGWGPYDTQEDGMWAEGELALTLMKAGHKVYSDQLKVAIARSSC
jgi:hypothetical protein